MIAIVAMAREAMDLLRELLMEVKALRADLKRRSPSG